MKMTKQDLLLAVRKASFVVPDALSLFGRMGEERIGKMQNGKAKRSLIDSTMVRTEMQGTLGGTPLGVSSETIEFRDFPVVTLQITLENNTDQTITLDHFSYFRREFCGEAPYLVDEQGNRYEVPNPPPRPPRGERPAPPPPGARPHFPHFDLDRYYLCFEDCTVMIESEGGKMFMTEPMGANIMLGTRDLTIAPGETKTFPKITLLVADGDIDRAKGLYAAFADRHL